MKKIMMRAIFLLVSSVIILNGCKKEYFDPEFFEKNYIIQGIPKNFTWSTISTIDVNVIPYDIHNNKYYYTIEIFDVNPVFQHEEKALLAKGVCSKDHPFQYTLNLPKGTSAVYVRQTSPEGQQTVQEYTVTGNKLTCNFNPAVTNDNTTFAKPITNSVMASNRSIGQTSFPTPASAIEINSTSPSPYEMESGKSYVVRGSYKGEIKYSWGNVSLYVEGTWENTSSTSATLENGDNLIIQNGGEIRCNNATSFRATSNTSKIVIAQNGKFNPTKKTVDLTFNNNAQFIIEGEVNLNNLTFENGTTLYNTGTINVNEFKIQNNNGIIENNGTIIAEDINIIGSQFTNSGTLTTDDLETEGSTFINNHKLTAKEIELHRGSFTNNCITLYEDFELEGTTMTLANNTLVKGEFMVVKGTTINLGGSSILSISNILSFKDASSKIIGTGREEFALMRAKKIESKDWKVIAYSGNLEIECSHYSKDPNSYTINEPAHWVAEGESTVDIPSSECNEDGNNTNPDQPQDPDFPVEGDSTLAYTWITEDMFPDLGDYDMNDLVVGISVSPALNADNMAESFTLKMAIRAVGSTRQMGAALQMDKLLPNEIQSITYNNNNLFEGKMFSTNNNGVENNQSQAVIPLFENAHKIMGVSNTITMVNTFALGAVVPGKGERKEIQKFEIKVQFSRPVSPDKINMTNLNFFVISGNKFITKRTEIHLPGFRHSNLSNITRPIEESTDGLMWGLLVPKSFRYPAEAISILKAYPDFEKWVKSGGSNYNEWYTSPSTNDAYIYR